MVSNIPVFFWLPIARIIGREIHGLTHTNSFLRPLRQCLAAELSRISFTIVLLQ